ncbi:acyl carrier protein [Streptomyces sp. G-G2]|uniref:acyl carrier protein n=1 Tax=Streptomyces sp. G-G2 TaxID=3046201 RepID=UPI0024BA7E73|nr:acyl carrier protein [Streptomyces sp. G-G2]MDJ0386281.1 acyl carrier protein [Streptomyces sp. G-G2]
MPKSTTREPILRTALARVTSHTADTLPEEGHLEQHLGIDSLALAELITTLEQDLGITIPDEETGRLQTVSDLRTLLDRLTPTSGTDTPS